MLFSDKLNFLMNLTQTSNKELAAAISVDRSLISLLRTGKRGMPRNREHISRMAYFFSKHCVADFQRHALSEMLEQSILRSSMPSSALAEYIFKWLSDDYDIVENTLSRISHTPAVPEPKHNISASNHISSSNDETEYFYGNSGKEKPFIDYSASCKRLSNLLRFCLLMTTIWNSCSRTIPSPLNFSPA